MACLCNLNLMTNGPLYDMIIDRSLRDMIYDHHDFFNPYRRGPVTPQAGLGVYHSSAMHRSLGEYI